jgi:hypothetical protein
LYLILVRASSLALGVEWQSNLAKNQVKGITGKDANFAGFLQISNSAKKTDRFKVADQNCACMAKVIINETDHEKTVHAKVGDEIEITLANNEAVKHYWGIGAGESWSNRTSSVLVFHKEA